MMTTSRTDAGAASADAGAVPSEVRRSATLVRTQIETTTRGHRADPAGRRPIPVALRVVLGLALGGAGLVALIGSARSGVETELEHRVEERLAAAGLDPALYSVEFDARSGRVRGPLPDGWSASRLSAVVTVDGASSVELDVGRTG